METYIYRTALELASLIRSDAASSVQIVRDHLDQIKRHNGQLQAMVSIFEEQALTEAAACDHEAQQGHFRGPLHGVPVTIKESFWIQGQRSTTNFKMLKDFIGPEDAVVVERIKKSGAIVLGQTNVPRNLLDYQVAGDLYPEGKNPYDLACTPGGSTGGGAAAVAAGFSPLELGSDFGGSVRVPANFCGLYGLKPTDKTVPLHGNIPLPKDADTFIVHMAQAGPLARDVDDLRILWQTIVGPHSSDRNIPAIGWQPPSSRSLGDYRVAWVDGWRGYPTSEPVKQAITQLMGKIQTQGCHTKQGFPDDTLHADSLEVFVGIFPYVITQGMPWFVRALVKRQLLSNFLKGIDAHPRMAKAMKAGFRYRTDHYGQVLLERSLMIQRWEHFFEEYDFLICPLAYGPAYPRCKTGSKLSYDGREMIYIDYTWPYVGCFNASGHPALTIPAGVSPEGLPLGIQIVGKYWSEPELLHFAKQVAALSDGFVKPVLPDGSSQP